MPTGLEPNVVLLEQAIENWAKLRAGITGDFQANGVNVPVSDLDRWLDENLRLLRLAVDAPSLDMAMLAVHIPNISSQVAAVSTLLQQGIANSPGWMQSQLPGLHSNLWSMRSSLVWIASPTAAGVIAPPLQIADSSQKLSWIEELYSALVAKLTEARISSEKVRVDADGMANFIQTTQAGLQAALDVVRGLEREVGNAKANAEGSAANAAAERERIAKLAGDLEALVKKQTELYETFNGHQKQVEALLEGASKVGLARSFKERRSTLEKTQVAWAISFAIAIALLSAAGYSVVWGIAWLHLVPVGNADDAVTFSRLLGRVLLAGPIIWFAWLAAVQYSRTMRLAEDYAFKEAAALSFVGYRREMGSDPEMVKLLQQSAIETFGANPADVLEKRDAGSPVHDLVDKAMEKGLLDKLIEVFKVIRPSR